MTGQGGEAEHIGYVMIGRVIIAFGQLDREMTSLLLTTKGPAGVSSVLDETVPRYFPLRVFKWVERVQAHCCPSDRDHLQTFARSLISISEVRNNLAHNVLNFVAHSSDAYTIEVQRLSFDGDSPFRRWIRRLTLQGTPAPPQDRTEPIIITADRRRILAQYTDKALDLVRSISEACRSGGAFTVTLRPPAGL